MSNGEVLSRRSIVTGWALLDHNSGPLSPGPNQRFCLPNDSITFRKVRPTDPSIRANLSIAARPSGNGIVLPSTAAMALRTEEECDATAGACWYSPCTDIESCPA